MDTDNKSLTPLEQLHIEPVEINDVDIPVKIKQLVINQPFSILCTQSDFHPYGSIISFATNENLSTVIFGTPANTRKYNYLMDCPHVAMVIDNRSDYTDNINLISAVTITGQARKIKDPSERSQYCKILTDKHPYLEKFANSENTAIFAINKVKYFYVTRFQEVKYWSPEE